jgi:hypothetical protein
MRPLAASIFGYLSLTLIISCSNAPSPEKLSIEHTTLLSSVGGDVLRPLDVKKIKEGFIVVGATTISNTPWAIEVTDTGKVVWNYSRQSASMDAASTTIARSPMISEFRAAAPMPDGSAYLCGVAEQDGSSPWTALVSHVSNAGTLLGETKLPATIAAASQRLRVGDCIGWKAGVVLVGGYVEHGDNRFFIACLDVNGEIKWERQFDPLPRSNVLPIGSIYTMVSDEPSGLIAISAANLSNSELFIVKNDGTITKRRAIVGNALLLPSPGGRRSFSAVIGLYNRITQISVRSISYDLNIQSEKNFSIPRNFFVERVSSDGSNSLLLSGTDRQNSVSDVSVLKLSLSSGGENQLNLKVAGSELVASEIGASVNESTRKYLVAAPLSRGTSPQRNGAALIFLDAH